MYEPTGNVDSWMAVGDEPVVVHIISYGAMEYLDEKGEVLKQDTAASLLEIYLRYCEAKRTCATRARNGVITRNSPLLRQMSIAWPRRQ